MSPGANSWGAEDGESRPPGRRGQRLDSEGRGKADDWEPLHCLGPKLRNQDQHQAAELKFSFGSSDIVGSGCCTNVLLLIFNLS